MILVTAARSDLPKDNGAPQFIAHPMIAACAVALAAAKFVGDKMK